MASKIHSASGGVSASQALGDEDGGFNVCVLASGDIAAEKNHMNVEHGVDCCKSQGGEEKEFRRARHSCLVRSWIVESWRPLDPVSSREEK